MVTIPYSSTEDSLCSLCRGVVITDSSSGELLCSSCGVVIKEKLETSSPMWRSFSITDYDDKARAGFPSSLQIDDTGLSTYIGASSPQARSTKHADSESDPHEKEKGVDYVHRASSPLPINRLRKLNAMLVSSTPISRNLRRSTWEINRSCSVLGLSWAIAERSTYFYRKALQKNLIKGRSIVGFVVA